MKLKTSETALVAGIFVSLMHILWLTMVYLGFANMYLTWVFGIHLLSNPYTVMPFDWGKAIILVVFTFIVGWAGGWVFAYLWNKLNKRK